MQTDIGQKLDNMYHTLSVSNIYIELPIHMGFTKFEYGPLQVRSAHRACYGV